MINKNMNWNNQPFLLKPAGKNYIWGGNRLNEDFKKNIDISPLAETWECSTHPDGLCTIRGGEFDGNTLQDILAMHPEYAGASLLENGQLPILIKLIDAREDLSVQVHPDDAYAAAHEPGSLGKNEMWYVLDAAPGAYLVYGFNRDIDKETLAHSLAQGTIEKYLQYVPIQKNDVFYIPAGQVHAIGAGALVAEVQETSNLTYRLYDYGRTDSNGCPRPLHIDKAMEVVNLRGSAEPRQPMRVLRYHRGQASELLCRCKYFQVERLLINTDLRQQPADCSPSGASFYVLLCVEGQGTLLPEGGDAISFSRGDCIFVPAHSAAMKLYGRAQFLRVQS